MLINLHERRCLVRRLLLTLPLCLLATPSNAGEMYYRTPGDPNSGNIYAVNENGGTPRVVLNNSEYSAGYTAAMTRFNHAGSNGQASGVLFHQNHRGRENRGHRHYYAYDSRLGSRRALPWISV